MSKTLIQLEYPYTELWDRAYLVVNPEQRKTVIFVKDNKVASSTSYARYMMSVKLKRLLLQSEHVDHIDNNRTNDVIENLQILSPLENVRKSAKGRSLVDLICDNCSKPFTREKRLLHTPRKYTCCSVACARHKQFYP